jgi:hypothetical protein
MDKGKENIKGNAEYANVITREVQGHDCKMKRNCEAKNGGKYVTAYIVTGVSNIGASDNYYLPEKNYFSLNCIIHSDI